MKCMAYEGTEGGLRLRHQCASHAQAERVGLCPPIDFVGYFKRENCHARKEIWSEAPPDGRWRAYSWEDLLRRDKTSLNVFCLKDLSMTDLENLRSALSSFEAVRGNQDRAICCRMDGTLPLHTECVRLSMLVEHAAATGKHS